MISSSQGLHQTHADTRLFAQKLQVKSVIYRLLQAT